jgi:hypothetical protein
MRCHNHLSWCRTGRRCRCVLIAGHACAHRCEHNITGLAGGSNT